MTMIVTSIVITYDVKEGVGMDKAVAAVTMNLRDMLHFMGLNDEGKPRDNVVLPVLCPPSMQTLVEVIDVKPLIVVGG